MPHRTALRVVLTVVLAASPAWAPAAVDAARTWTFSLYFENDLFADTDQSYTNGVKIAGVSPDLRTFEESGKLPAWSLPLVRALPFINAPGRQRNVSLAAGQAMYTPRDIEREDLVLDDRPYAGWTYFAVGFHSKSARSVDSLEVQLGWVGPLSFAEESQKFVHSARGLPTPNGWDNQIGNEPGIALVYERKRRHWRLAMPAEFGFDAISHAGGAVGNVATYLNAGTTLRLGWRLPYDFGTSLIRPAGETDAPVAAEDPRLADGRRPSVHLFASADGRVVLRDIFLDGNTFADSHSVSKRPLVLDLAAGISFTVDRFKLSFARVLRTREFEGQPESHRFGSITLSVSF